jgi:small-conductance mechanosensitive channel
VRRQVRKALADDPADATTLNALGFVGRILLWSVLLLMALANLGIQIGPLLAGLGVGGIAVALALQNILGDLFASLSIVLDKPFVVGDFVVVGDLAGTVEYVGLKTTRVRSLSGEQLVFSNSDLLSSRIRNYKRMQERRIAFTVGVTYQTARERLAEIPLIAREIIEAQENARFDRAHFKAFGAFSLDFEIVYYVLDPDYNAYMNVQQAINLALYERFEAAAIEFAFPTQTLILERAAARGPAVE